VEVAGTREESLRQRPFMCSLRFFSTSFLSILLLQPPPPPPQPLLVFPSTAATAPPPLCLLLFIFPTTLEAGLGLARRSKEMEERRKRSLSGSCEMPRKEEKWVELS
jgi:hypothetical protein